MGYLQNRWNAPQQFVVDACKMAHIFTVSNVCMMVSWMQRKDPDIVRMFDLCDFLSSFSVD